MKWQRTTPIMEDEANAEPEADRIFGPSYERRQRQIRARARREVTIERDLWKGKPRMERAKQG